MRTAEHAELKALHLPTHRPPTHPGELLAARFLRKTGRTQAARDINISVRRLNELIKGRRRITVDMAIRLARMFNTTPQFWLTMQANRDLWYALRRRG